MKLRVSAEHARRFHRRAVHLDVAHSTIADALTYHGYVQIDPINVCGRMHDLILRNRVQGYREGDLMRHLHGDGTLEAEARVAFEHFIPYPGVLAAFPLDAWRFLRHSMRCRAERNDGWSGRLDARERLLAETLLHEIERRGPLSSEDFDDTRKARAVWGAATLVKSTMQKLFFHGVLLIARRGVGQRRVYDLAARVLPRSVLTAPTPGDDEVRRWEILLRLRQRRLVALKRGELPYVEADTVALHIHDGPTLYALREDLALVDSTAHDDETRRDVMLLAPLDPLVYDRKVTASLWNFDYIWEVYTPPAKRVRGYYALPVLSGTQLVGHVEPKADRSLQRLRVITRSVQRGHNTTGAVHALAAWLGLKAR